MSIRDKVSSFFSSGAVINGPVKASATVLALAASTMMTPVAIAGEAFDYSGMVREVQAKVDADFGAGKIVVIDLSGDVNTEIRRMLDAGPDNAGPHASEDVCFVLGADPSLTADRFFTRHGRTMNHGDVGTEDVQKWMLYREIGQCFDIPKAAQVEMFAAFMTAPHSTSTDLMPMMAGLAEYDELTGGSEHLVSPSLRMTAQLLEQGSYRSMMARAKVQQAAHYVADVGVGELTRWQERTGKALGAAMELEQHYVPVQQGLVVTDRDGWMHAASGVPEVARLIELDGYLYGDSATRVLPEPFLHNRSASTREVTRLAHAGDPTARMMSTSFAVDDAYRYVAVATEGLPDAGEIDGTLVAFDRENLLMKYSEGNGAFFGTDRDHALVFVGGPEGMRRVFDTAVVPEDDGITLVSFSR